MKKLLLLVTALVLAAGAVELIDGSGIVHLKGVTDLIHPFHAQTANLNLAVTDCNSVQSNAGAGGAVQISLPTPPSSGSCELTFVVEAAQTLTVKATNSATIRGAAVVSVANGTAASNVIGNTITIVSTSSTTWVSTGVVAPTTGWSIN
jgi:hypothetical protein